MKIRISHCPFTLVSIILVTVLLSGLLASDAWSQVRLSNISTRAKVLTGDDIAIAGFIIEGNDQKCVVVRGRGPSVGVPTGVPRLPNPRLTLKSGQTIIASNNDWQAQEVAGDDVIISDLGMAPSNPLDAALYICLAPGPYTALLRDTNNATGAGIVEVLDADPLASSSLQTQINELKAQVLYLSLVLSDVTRGTDPNTGQDTLTFTDMNVQVVNGSGGTDNTPTGTGNLIIGYNELRPEGSAIVPCPSDVETEFYCNRRTGSHMLVVGTQNNYTSYGGTVTGRSNETASKYASVSGGSGNIASGMYSSISGGYQNIASNNDTSVSGGVYNEASGEVASVSGGYGNEASGMFSSVSGGYQKTASANYCTVGDDGVDC